MLEEAAIFLYHSSGVKGNEEMQRARSMMHRILPQRCSSSQAAMKT